jgi:undecaprenyl-diphosphatase
MATHSSLLARFDHAEYRLCRRLNRGVERTWVRVLFKTASRLGDGVIWYVLMLALPLMYGSQGLRVGLIMLATSAANLATYKFLKRTFVRERPFIRHAGISLAQSPLDRYSFPSGHTLHAVAFTWQAVAAFPELGFVLVPLALAIAASRVVLGLHYPTDVLVGALLGVTSGVIGAAIA